MSFLASTHFMENARIIKSCFHFLLHSQSLMCLIRPLLTPYIKDGDIRTWQFAHASDQPFSIALSKQIYSIVSHLLYYSRKPSGLFAIVISLLKHIPSLTVILSLNNKLKSYTVYACNLQILSGTRKVRTHTVLRSKTSPTISCYT